MFMWLWGCCIPRCQAKAKVEQHFEMLSRQGVTVYYWAGSKHSPARLILDVPRAAGMGPGTAQVVGQAAMKSMNVQVPQGSGPGSTLQVQTPEGTQIQVVVPPTAGPGQVF